jgi:hypothetical protein
MSSDLVCPNSLEIRVRNGSMPQLGVGKEHVALWKLPTWVMEEKDEAPISERNLHQKENY